MRTEHVEVCRKLTKVCRSGEIHVEVCRSDFHFGLLGQRERVSRPSYRESKKSFKTGGAGRPHIGAPLSIRKVGERKKRKEVL